MKIFIIALGILVMATVTQAQDTVVVQTTMGSFTIALYRNDAPKTVENFVELSKKGFYDSILVHRISHDFVIQMGDPLTKDKSKMARWGTGGESIYGGAFADELNEDSKSYLEGYQKGIVAMANSGPNTNTSQFFVLLDDASNWMPHNYTIFGKVIDGMDVVEKIGEQPVVGGANDGRPVSDIMIKHITVK
jgi:cyclophilin family peptidyl-prolyl cis-trans isomerase